MIHTLYVDDEEGLLDLAKVFLEHSGQLRVDTFLSVNEAEEAMKLKNYDAVISDYQMAGTDGIEFLKRLRAEGNDIPFILFTGRGREEVVIQALNSGANFYLQKGGDTRSQYVELEHKVKEAVEKRKAEQELETKSSQLKAAVKMAKLAYWTLDTSTWLYTVDDLMWDLLATDAEREGGYQISLDEYLKNIVHPEEVPQMMERMSYYLDPSSTDASGQLHFRIIRRDGNVRNVVAYLELKRNPSGSVTKVTGAIQDVTETKAAERLAEENELKYRMLAENVNDVIWKMDLATHRFTYISASVEALRGFTANEVLGQRLEDAVPAEDLPFLMDMLADHVLRYSSGEEKARLVRGILRQNHRDGHWVSMEISGILLKDKNGAITELLGVSRDVTERLRSETALRENERLLRTVFENSLDGIYLLDMTKGNYVLMSPSQALITGFEMEELNSLTLDTVIERTHPDDREAAVRHFNRVLAGENLIYPMEYRWKVKSGEYRWMSDRQKPILDENGKALFVVGICRDITESKSR